MSINKDTSPPTDDSFWEIDGYKQTVRRQENGASLATDLMSLIQERADIEKLYAKNLQNWSKKWTQTVEKSPEYGTTEAAWKALLHEADSLAQVHNNIRDNLMTDVHSKIKEWKLANYKKPVVGVYKETKQLEDEFKKAQKPWEKKYIKVKEAKKQYHNACKVEKSVTNQENNAKADSSLSADQLRKIQEKAEKCRREVELTRQKYEAALTDLNNYNAKYMEDMVMVFEKSDANEERRLFFFKEMMFGIHKCIDLSSNVDIPQIYSQLYSTINQANYRQDLKWWSQNYGKDMPMNWPQFEEYQESHHSISRKEKSKSHHIGASDGITLTGLKTDNSRPPSIVDPIPQNGSSNPFEDDTPPRTSPRLQSKTESCETDLSEKSGVQVRALYDYVAVDDDELSFKQGDVFRKLEERDAQGWCTGYKDGKVGFYPDNYVELL